MRDTSQRQDADSACALARDACGEALSLLGRHDEAVVALQHNLKQLPTNRPNQTEGTLAYVYARAVARRAMENLRVKNRGVIPAMGVLASTQEVLGDHTAAVTLLKRAVSASLARLPLPHDCSRRTSCQCWPQARWAACRMTRCRSCPANRCVPS